MKKRRVGPLMLTLHGRFAGAELIFDTYSPLHNWVSNLKSTRLGLRTHWGIWRGRTIEGPGDAVHRLDEWGFPDRPEPRLARIQSQLKVPVRRRQ